MTVRYALFVAGTWRRVCGCHYWQPFFADDAPLSDQPDD